MGFRGREAVQRRRRTMQAQVGAKVGAATLRVRTSLDTFSSVSYAYAYRWPGTEDTGLGGDGLPTQAGRITLFQEGETSAPRADGQIVIGSTTYQIVRAQTRLNADTNYAVHDCDVVY